MAFDTIQTEMQAAARKAVADAIEHGAQKFIAEPWRMFRLPIMEWHDDLSLTVKWLDGQIAHFAEGARNGAYWASGSILLAYRQFKRATQHPDFPAIYAEALANRGK
jgi:hypothetical protein